jgi:molecular chaperone DnaK (HSP70)
MKLLDLLKEEFGKVFNFTDFIYTTDKYLSPQTQTAQSTLFKLMSADLKKALQDPAQNKQEIQALQQVLKSLGY